VSFGSLPAIFTLDLTELSLSSFLMQVQVDIFSPCRWILYWLFKIQGNSFEKVSWALLIAKLFWLQVLSFFPFVAHRLIYIWVSLLDSYLRSTGKSFS